MSAIRLRFDPAAASGDPLSRESLRTLGATLAAQARQSPGTFAELQRRHGGAVTLRWRPGRGPAGLTGPVARLAMGAISDPIESEFCFFYVAQRVEPSTVATTPAPSFTLPAPAAPDIPYVVRTRSGKALAGCVRALSERVAHMLPLERRSAARIASVHADSAKAFDQSVEGDGPGRVARYERAMARIREYPRSGELTGYAALKNAQVEDMLLRPPR